MQSSQGAEPYVMGPPSLPVSKIGHPTLPPAAPPVAPPLAPPWAPPVAPPCAPPAAPPVEPPVLPPKAPPVPPPVVELDVHPDAANAADVPPRITTAAKIESLPNQDVL